MSSVIADIRYNPTTGVTTVDFVNGNTYDYTTIPENIVEEWKNAPSLGKYFNQHIKGKYS